MPFIHLRVRSAYSLAEGALPIKTIIDLCKRRRMPAVAVTDTNNLFGGMEFAIDAAKAGIQPILGIALDVQDHGSVGLLVQSEDGYRTLCHLLARAYMSEERDRPSVSLDELCSAGASGGLIALSGGLHGPIGRALGGGQHDQAETLTKTLRTAFGDRLMMEIQRHGLPAEQRIEGALIDLAYAHDVPLLATNNCYFPDPDFFEAHEALLCISEGRYISETDRRRSNAAFAFHTADHMARLFADLPEAIQNTALVAQRCHFLLTPVATRFPKFATQHNRSEAEEIRAIATDGLAWRIREFVGTTDAGIIQSYQERLTFELEVIISMGFAGYFLIVSDFIRWAKGQGIPVGPGRGSGAGSLVAWSLAITDLDPIALGLLFERFLNPDRVSLPDFDIDFCQARRDDVIGYVQERYGHDSVAQIITFGKLQARAVIKDVGRVMQMPYGQVDKISKMIPHNPANPVTLAEALAKDSELQAARINDETVDRLITIALRLEGLYRHASTHAAGVVIGDRPLADLLPLYRDPRSTMPVTQYNMKYIEQAGLIKFDFLGLKTLTVIRQALDIIRAGRGQDIDILKIPLDDERTFTMLASGAGSGVFQLESSGMRDVLKKLKPTRFVDIIALVALYRPGPMENIPLYIGNKNGDTVIDYMHPKLQPMLEETYGVLIYQEQVMQAAQILAGYTLGGADLLRRAMGKKIKSEMDAQRDHFVQGCAKHSDMPPEQAGHIFDQIEKFAGYGFNKSHAAAYALIAYQTAWLKANYPLEFWAATLTLDMGNTDKLALLRQELLAMDIPLLPPDINRSHADFSVEGEGIRYALGAIKGVGFAAMQSIVTERDRHGPYVSLEDFFKRIDPKSMNRRGVEVLAASGALQSIHPSRAAVFRSADRMIAYLGMLADERMTGQSSLFGGGGTADLGLPTLVDGPEWDGLECLQHEFDAIGFYLSAHPLDPYKAQLERQKVVDQAALRDRVEQNGYCRVTMAGVVIRKQEKMSKAGKKFAFLHISDLTGVFEVMVFSELLLAHRDLMNEGKSLLLSVDADIRDGQLRLTAQSVKALDTHMLGALKSVAITLEDLSSIQNLNALLTTEGRGDITITLITPLASDPQRRAHLRLPGRYTLSFQGRNRLYQLPGLLDIQEN